MEEEREQETRRPPDHGPGRRRPDRPVPRRAPAPAAAAIPKGHLFIIGGGERDEPMMRRFVEVAQAYDAGKDRRFPDGLVGSGRGPAPTPGRVRALRRRGRRGLPPDPRGGPEARRDRRSSTASAGSSFRAAIRRGRPPSSSTRPSTRGCSSSTRPAASSAGRAPGAAVMSEFMITGDEKRTNPRRGTSGSRSMADDVVTAEGFGFVKTAIIDQHFVTRRRHNRLISRRPRESDARRASASTSRRPSLVGADGGTRSSARGRSSSTTPPGQDAGRRTAHLGGTA